MNVKNNHRNLFIILIFTIVLAGLSGLLLFFFISYSKKLNISEDKTTYARYYAMITDDSDSVFSQAVYKSAKEHGKEMGAYVDMISENLSQDYSGFDLMEIAIASGADGIIISANESEEMISLIDKASDKNIPVVTLFSDSPLSERISFVGISNYNLGITYGNLVTKIAKEKVINADAINVLVLMDAKTTDASKNVLYAAIKDVVENEPEAEKQKHLPINISSFTIDSSNNFSVEESVRSLFMQKKENLPNIVVCQNEIDTTSLYQAVVDYNVVGLVNILGYYDSESILRGIERGVIYASVSIDSNKMGAFCVDALDEYHEFGNTSQYFTTDISVITKENVNEYFAKEDGDE